MAAVWPSLLLLLLLTGWSEPLSYEGQDTIALDDLMPLDDTIVVRKNLLAQQPRPSVGRSRVVTGRPLPYNLHHQREIGLLGEPYISVKSDRTYESSATHVSKPGSTKTEVMRFITPYGRNMSKFLDITSLANQLHGSNLSVFIDTWSPAPTEHLLLQYVNNVTEKVDRCQTVNKSFGDGWRVSATIVLSNVSCAARPALRVIPLTQGMESFPMGSTAGIDGALAGNKLAADGRAQFEALSFDVLKVCNLTVAKLRKRLSWEYAIEQFGETPNMTVKSAMSSGLFDNQMHNVAYGVVEAISSDSFHLTGLSRPAATGDLILARPLTVRPTERFPKSTLQQIATVSDVQQQPNGVTKLAVAWHQPKLCLNGTRWKVLLVAPSQLNKAHSFLESAMTAAQKTSTAPPVREMGVGMPLDPSVEVHGDRHVCVPLIRKSWTVPNDTALPKLADGNVSVVGYNYTGNIFKRQFHLEVAAAEKAVLQLVTTGHGQYGALQCGEFCEIELTVKLDGEPLGTFMQSPPNCSDNPVTEQLGNWEGPRAQWCPGSVLKQPTKSFDITTLLHDAQLHDAQYNSNKVLHEVTVDIAVREMFGNGTFKKYNDPMGFVFGQNGVWQETATATLRIGMSVLVESNLNAVKPVAVAARRCPAPDPWYEVPFGISNKLGAESNEASFDLIRDVTADKAKRVLVSERILAPAASQIMAHAAAGKQVGLLLELKAPVGGKPDRWDRLGSVSLDHSQPPAVQKKLPTGPLVVGYANWGQCDDKLMRAVDDGVNVLVWFSINLSVNVSTGLPSVSGPASGTPFLQCVARMTAEMSTNNPSRPLTHLVSIGGWNSPHPDTRFGATVWWRVLQRWNELTGIEGWSGFDGFDWDIEGNDDGASPSNHFTVETLDLMGELSKAAKNAGYIVTMAPAQSYLDSSTSQFSRNVDIAPQWKEDFHYGGRNVYAYLIAKYEISTFDLVSVQLYEGWSHAKYQIDIVNETSPSEYLTNLITRMQQGWNVDFTADTDPRVAALGNPVIRIPREKLVIGLANGWAAKVEKFVVIMPEDCVKAYSALDPQTQPRGFMFWDIADEGTETNVVQLVDGKPMNVSQPLWMAKGLAEIFQ